MTHKTLSNRNLIIAIATTTFGLLLICWLFVIPQVTGNLVVKDYDKVKGDLRAVLASVNAPGEIIYNEIKDDNCTNANSVGLQERVTCGLTGSKIFSNNGDLSNDLHMVNDQLLRLGFQTTALNGQTDKTFTDALKGTNFNYTIAYAKKDYKDPRVELSFYQDANRANDYRIRTLIDGRKLDLPEAGHYLYGITVNAGYYSCASVLFEPCLFQPSR